MHGVIRNKDVFFILSILRIKKTVVFMTITPCIDKLPKKVENVFCYLMVLALLVIDALCTGWAITNSAKTIR